MSLIIGLPTPDRFGGITECKPELTKQKQTHDSKS